MPGISVRLPFAISLLITLLLVVFAGKPPASVSQTESRDSVADEQARAIVQNASSSVMNYSNQLSANNADQLIELASKRREPLLLLLLGAVLLSIATAMKLLLWRKSGKTSGLQSHDE